MSTDVLHVSSPLPSHTSLSHALQRQFWHALPARAGQRLTPLAVSDMIADYSWATPFSRQSPMRHHHCRCVRQDGGDSMTDQSLAAATVPDSAAMQWMLHLFWQPRKQWRHPCCELSDLSPHMSTVDCALALLQPARTHRCCWRVSVFRLYQVSVLPTGTNVNTYTRPGS